MCYYTRAWQTVGSGTSAYEVWMGDTALTEGLGFAPDVNGIQTWAGPPATHPWPMFKWGVNQTTKAPQPVTFGITFDPTQAWNNVTQRFSLTSNSWQRFSLTSQDWAGYSLRGNGWQ